MAVAKLAADPQFLTTEELAAELKVPKATLAQWRHKGTGPCGYRVGRFIRYRRADVEAWLATRADKPSPAA